MFPTIYIVTTLESYFTNYLLIFKPKIALLGSFFISNLPLPGLMVVLGERKRRHSRYDVWDVNAQRRGKSACVIEVIKGIAACKIILFRPTAAEVSSSGAER